MSMASVINALPGLRQVERSYLSLWLERQSCKFSDLQSDATLPNWLLALWVQFGVAAVVTVFAVAAVGWYKWQNHAEEEEGPNQEPIPQCLSSPLRPLYHSYYGKSV